MKRTDRAALLLGIFCCLFAFAAGGDEVAVRASFSAAEASALEAAVSLVRPGSRVVWQTPLAVEASDGTRSSLLVGDTIERRDASGSTVVLAMEFPDGEQDLYAKIRAFEPLSGTSPTEIVTVKLNADGVAVATRRGILNDSAVLTRVRALELTPEGVSGGVEWPDVYVVYRAVYATNDWWGEIRWESQVTTSPVSVVHRLPSLVSKTERSGAALLDVPIVVVNEDIDSFSIISPERQKIVTRCAVPCVPDGRVLLGLW